MWIELNYTTKQIDSAGKVLTKEDFCLQEYEEALNIINNWRASHAFPLNTFQTFLRRHSISISKKAIVAQRLKKLDSIKSKLKRFKNMELSRMQDIGGCRVILPNIKNVYKLAGLIKESRIRHKLVNEKDYIKEPKESGYRGIHLVYRYFSERTEKFNNLQIEIQIRTSFQHIWATAVETVGVFINDSLKSSQGPDEWLRLFTLMSSFYAVGEKSKCAPNTPCEFDELVHEIRAICLKNDFLKKLQAFNAAVKYLNMPQYGEGEYYILILRYGDRKLSIRNYQKNEIEKATQQYIEFEKREKVNGNDVVLVSANSIENLKKAYPNYFMDTKEFTSTLEYIIQQEIINNASIY